MQQFESAPAQPGSHSQYGRYDEVAEVYAAYLETRNITDTCHLCLGNGDLLNDAQLASEIRQGSARGKAVVEAFIDGAAGSNRLTLDEALQEFRQFIAGNAVSDSGGDERT